MNIKTLTAYFIILCWISASFSCNGSKNQKQTVTQETSLKRPYKPSDFNKLTVLHSELDEPIPGDWLYYKDEQGQSFRQYINSSPVVPDEKRDKIYLLPIGEFTDIDRFVIKEAAKFMKIFLSVDVIIQKEISADIIPNSSKRYNFDILQLHTKYILRQVLVKQIPEDAVSYMAITSDDLYPADDWNFVFGQASIKKRVGVSSICRLKYDNLDSTNYQLYLKRLSRTTTHENCHMFSMLHCINYTCLMNGSMNQEEADSKPMYLCAECLTKLMWCSNNGVIKRFKLLKAFFDKHGFAAESKYCSDAMDILLKLQ